MLFRNTIALILLCSSAVARAVPSAETCLEALESGQVGDRVLGIIGFSGAPAPDQWLFLVENDDGTLLEQAISSGKIVAERMIEPLPGQDLPDIVIDFSKVVIDSDNALSIASGLAMKNRVDFESAHFHLRCRDSGNEPVWLLKLLGPKQDSRGVVYLSAATGEVLRTAWTVRAIEEFASAFPAFTRMGQ